MSGPEQRWPMEALGKVARVFAGSAAPQGSEYFSDDGPPFFRVSDVSAHGRTRNLLDAANGLSRECSKACPLLKLAKVRCYFQRAALLLQRTIEQYLVLTDTSFPT